MIRVLATSLVLFAATAAFAGPDKSKPAAGPKCPGGGNYTLKQTPSKGHSAKVSIDGKTYYACQNCADKLNRGKTAKQTAAKRTVAKKAAPKTAR